MTDFLFNYKGKKINLDVRECRTFFSKMSGLMFRKNSKPLLFVFKKENRSAIHSFFCVPFIVIWFSSGKIVDFKLINNAKSYIVPMKKFDKFLEIPINSKDFPRVKSLFNL